MRKLAIYRKYNKYALGSCLFCMGDTKVLCNATIQNNQPPHLKDTQCGWITAEYAMLPQASDKRSSRTQILNSGRTKEISRVIGRSLRAAFDLLKIGPLTVTVDCDVLQADGGTRTAAINGAFIAVYDLFLQLKKTGKIDVFPIKKFIGSISLGIVEKKIVIDLNKLQDNNADCDMSLVMTDKEELVELQYTAEKDVIKTDVLNKLIKLGSKEIKKIIEIEKRILRNDLKQYSYC